MIRHNEIFGSAIAVVISVSSEDRFRKFQKLFIEVHDKLGMTAELIKKKSGVYEYILRLPMINSRWKRSMSDR